MTSHVVTRLTVPIAALSVLLLALTVVAAWYVHDMQERASGPIATSVESVTAAQELEISIREVASQFNRFLITLDRKHLETVPRLKTRTAAALANAEAAATTPAEASLMKRTRQGYDHFFAEYDKVLQSPPPQGLYAEIIKLTDNVLLKEILEPAHEYLQLNEGVLTQASETNRQLARRLSVGLLAVGMFGSIGGLLGGWVIAAAVRRSLIRSELQLLTTAEQLDQAANPGGRSDEPGARPLDALERVSVSVSAVLRRLRDTERAALRAEQLAWVGQMAAGIAHEIRNPLMAIKLLVQAAGDRPDGPALRARDFQVLEEEINRLERIVAGFLDFARPPRPEPRIVNVGELAANTADSIRPKADLQGVNVVVEEDEPAVVSADPNQLRQVLLNLLFNAIEAQPRGGEIRVSARVESTSSVEPHLLLTVADAGPGLPAMGDRIFEPFVSTKESGLGLGLSICRRIAESHGGTLSGSAGTRGGAVFTFRIPVGARQMVALNGRY